MSSEEITFDSYPDLVGVKVYRVAEQFLPGISSKIEARFHRVSAGSTWAIFEILNGQQIADECEANNQREVSPGFFVGHMDAPGDDILLKNESGRGYTTVSTRYCSKCAYRACETHEFESHFLTDGERTRIRIAVESWILHYSYPPTNHERADKKISRRIYDETDPKIWLRVFDQIFPKKWTETR